MNAAAFPAIPPLELNDARRVLEAAFTRGWLDDDQRALARALVQRLGKALTTEVGEAAITVAQDGSGFARAEGDWVDLRRRRPLRRILATLLAARTRGLPAKKEELIACGWPGEKLLPDAASNRLHVALSEMRKMGLSDAIQYRRGGWMLDPAMAIGTCADGNPGPA